MPLINVRPSRRPKAQDPQAQADDVARRHKAGARAQRTGSRRRILQIQKKAGIDPPPPAPVVPAKAEPLTLTTLNRTRDRRA